MTWKAYVIGPGGDFTDPLSQRAKLYLYRRSERSGDVIEYATGVLTIQSVQEGTLATDGIDLLPEMLEPIREAIEKMNGRPETNPAAENRVLREWLAVEQERVERALSR